MWFARMLCPDRVLARTEDDKKQERIKREYPRTQYEMYSPQDGLLDPPSPERVQEVLHIAGQYQALIPAILENACPSADLVAGAVGRTQALPPAEEAELQKTMSKVSPSD